MKAVMLRVILVVAFVIGLAWDISAKDWRGLVPLRSTREDVERLLGVPQPPPKDGTRSYTLNEGRSIYFLDEGEVYIVYAEALFDGPRRCLDTVAAGTVLTIEITPNSKRPISEFVI